MINAQVEDLCRQGSHNIAAQKPADIEAVRSAGPLIAFSGEMQDELRELKQFLRNKLYRHYRVNRMSSKAQRIIRELFAAFHDDPRLMPEDFQQRAQDDKPRAVADYIAGMTDRYAIREYRRLFTVEELPL
jgi:dGTPase